jgi:UDPglucose 6-dehydrogenase
MTEWKEFRMPRWGEVKVAMRGNVIVDGRNIYDPAELRAEGFVYSRIGLRHD